VKVLRSHRFLRHEDGNVIIETAIMISILLVLIFGILDFGRAMYVENQLVSAARESARGAAAYLPAGGPTLSDSAKTIAINRFKPFGSTVLNTSNVTVTCSNGCSSPSNGSIKVDLSYSFTWITPVWRLLKWTTTSKFNASTGASTFGASSEYRYEL
jgi:Flp pilus assembly protein TadG